MLGNSARLLQLVRRDGGAAAAPTLSNAVDAANGPTAATGSVDTTGGDGTLYVVAIPAGDSAPSASEVKAGQRAGGSAAPFAGSQAVVATGTQTLAGGGGRPTMLAPETGYKLAFMHESAGALQSDVLVADGFTTATILIGSAEGGGTNTTNPTTITTSLTVKVGDAVVVCSSEQGSAPTVTAVTDNLGNTYTAVDADGGVIGGVISGMQFVSFVTNAGTITAINFAATASSNDIALKAAAYNGPFSAVDAAPAMRNDTASPFTGNATGTLAQASELVVGCLCTNNVASTITATSPWTLAGSASAFAGRQAAICHLNVDATTSVTPSFTATDSSAVVGTMSFKRAA